MTAVSSSSSSSSSRNSFRQGRRWRITVRRFGVVVVLSAVVIVINTNIRFYKLTTTTISTIGDDSGGPINFGLDEKSPKRVGSSKFVPAAGTKEFAQRHAKESNSIHLDGRQQKQEQDHVSSSTTSSSTASTKVNKHQLDYLLDPNAGWDVSPIVVEEFKLVLFTTPKIATTVWKQLARRMMHYDNWREENLQLPHYPQYNGIRYLYHYRSSSKPSTDNKGLGGILTTTPTIDEILTSPLWTRAIFVRDPVERLVSAYLDKAVRDDNGWYVKHHCCGFTRQEKSIKSITKPNGRVTALPESGSTTLNNGGQFRRRLTKVSSSSSDNKISDSFRQMIQEERQKRLAPGLLPGMDLPPYCEKLMSEKDVESNIEKIDSNNNINGQRKSVSSSSLVATSTIPFDVFVLEFLPVCDDAHWRPQSQRLDRGSRKKKKRQQQQRHSSIELLESNDVWKYINFIGRFDTLASDAKHLLQNVGAWEQYGASGWESSTTNNINRRGYPRRYKDDKEPSSSSSSSLPIFGSNEASHRTDAKNHVQEVFGTSRLEIQRAIWDFYRDDYDHPVLGSFFNRSLN
mmetsp:Transcript_21097/g.50141  ORF Transcript_21097/g.50141 Transcript_21097/m.50141 type:complete len:571 (-) Transcript_21097:732-2444(-)